MEISRIIHDDVVYEIGAEINEIKKEKVASPYFYTTVKTAKRKRGKKLSLKKDNLFKKIQIKNPISLYKKIYKIYDDFLKDFNYVTFTAWNDDEEKRIRVYIKGLEKMGFKLDYIYICPWHKSWKEYVMCRKGYELKKKEYSKIFKSLYGSYIWNGKEWFDEVNNEIYKGD